MEAQEEAEADPEVEEDEAEAEANAPAAERLRARCEAAGEATVDLLGGRAILLGPSGMAVESNQPPNIMAAPADASFSTDAALSGADGELFVRARELSVRAPRALERVAPEFLAPWIGLTPDAIEVQTVEARSVDSMVVVAPREPRTIDGALTLFAALVDPGDHHLVFVGIGVRGSEDAETLGACRERARRMLSSIRNGRALDVSGGPRTIGSGGGSITIDLPPGWVHRSQRGPDFVVHHFTRIEPLGSSSPSVGLYLGGHPSRHGAGPATGRVVLLGQEVEVFEEATPGAFLTEGFVELGGHGIAHVWYEGADARSMREAGDVARTLTITR